MIGMIGMIIFTIELGIMQVLAVSPWVEATISEGVVDATCLTLLASPVIYLWVTKPFAESAKAAKQALAAELKSKTSQAEILEKTVQEMRLLFNQNEDLRSRLQRASQEVAESNELILHRIGADLHDGPAQLLSFALLKFNTISRVVERNGSAAETKELNSVRSALSDTLREIRNLSEGLAVPAIEHATMRETIALVVASHEQHTGTGVRLNITDLPDFASPASRIAIYRFLQEALSNAYRHAGGRNQVVTAAGVPCGDEVRLVLTVSDGGPGLTTAREPTKGLGLASMRSRIEALGGTLEISACGDGGGTSLTASLPHSI